MSQKSASKDPNLLQKLNKLKEKQDNWMKERETAKSYTPKNYVHSSLKSSQSVTKQRGKQNQQDVKKNDEALVWTANSNYKGFVVRNGSGSERSRQTSARTPTAKKPYTHSSLKNKESKTNVTSRSANAKSSSGSVGKMDQEKISNIEEPESQSDESLSTSFTEHMSNLNFNKFSASPTVTSANSLKLKTKQKNGNTFMANHYCGLCNRVMVTEDRKPQMVFPCGHSFCRKCIMNKEKCPDCDCGIISTQTNESLYMVIQQFKQRTDKEELEKKEKQTRKYLEEYKNLNTRISIMKGEATNIIDDMEDITHQLIDKQNVIKKQEENIEQLENEIIRLKQIVQQQHQDIELENDDVKGLEKSYDKEKSQLNMLQNTISSLTENKEKLRGMVQDLSPNAIPLLNDLDDEL